MRLGHFHGLEPLCPACRERGAVARPLGLGTVAAARGDRIVQGTLVCPDPACRAEYPIIDGIPILVANLRSFIAENVVLLTLRDDLSGTVEDLLGDALGPGTFFDSLRQHLSSYGWDHYGEFDAGEPDADPDARPGAVVRCLDAGLGLLGRPMEGPALDLGCAVGRVPIELARRVDGLVLGLDVHVAMLRLAQRVLESGVVSYPRRRIGVVYDRREFQAALDRPDRVDVWLANAMAVPFADGTFGFVSALNLLDCVGSPRDMLAEVARLLRPGAGSVLATPFDWAPQATPIEAWIGGHSAHGADAGAAEPRLRQLLAGEGHPIAVPGLRVRGIIERFPWHVRVHDRSTMRYATHVVALDRDAA